MNQVVERTEGFSGRELERLCKEVTTKMISEMNRDLPAVVDSGLEGARGFEVRIRPIEWGDWETCIGRITPATTNDEMAKYVRWNDQVDS